MNELSKSLAHLSELAAQGGDNVSALGPKPVLIPGGLRRPLG